MRRDGPSRNRAGPCDPLRPYPLSRRSSDRERTPESRRTHGRRDRRALEWMNIGRLRMASKGVDRAPDGPGGSRLAAIPDDEQYARGMYMIGQLASLRDRDHHNRGASRGRLWQRPSWIGGARAGSARRRGAAPHRATWRSSAWRATTREPAACGLLGEHARPRQRRHRGIPATHWDWWLYYDANPRRSDKIVSKWGGFLDDMPVRSAVLRHHAQQPVASIEPLQLCCSKPSPCARRRRLREPPVRSRADGRSILGVGGGGSPLAVSYGFRTCLPLLDTVPGWPIELADVLRIDARPCCRSGPRTPSPAS